MKYSDVLNEIAEKEKISAKEVREEIESVLKLTKIDCSVEEFLSIVTDEIAKRLYIVQ
ncbi:MAG: hypothetical protein IJE01_00895 [Clostridia bacterium]|mgnify:CR=1 FL=1|nr:hypothetical protein [Clostridia bacterium]